MLELNDTGSDSGRVYHELVRYPNSTIAALADRTGLPVNRLGAALSGLRTAGMAVREGERWGVETSNPATGPNAPVDDRAGRRSAAEAELAEMVRTVERDRRGHAALEVLEGPAALQTSVRRLQNDARDLVRGINRPPYVGDVGYRDRQTDIKCGRLAEGVRYQTIYHESVYAHPKIGADMMRTIGCGEQARVLPDPPVKLVVGDDHRGVLVLETASPTQVALLVHPCGLLTSLINVFETLWRLAVPATAEPADDSLDARDREIMTLMAAGATDDAIARRLGLSRRTVVRRATAMLGRLGATTRFQAGVQAARRGWL